MDDVDSARGGDMVLIIDNPVLQVVSVAEVRQWVLIPQYLNRNSSH